MKKRNVAILGAAGRDFHNFLTVYKDNEMFDVKFFTAEQIPGIENRTFPKELAGKLYKKDIPIYPEEQMTELIKKYENYHYWQPGYAWTRISESVSK